MIRTVARSAGGKTLSHSTWQNGVRLEYAEYGYDGLGHMNVMRRYKDPTSVADPVIFQWKTDSTGYVVELHEPETAARTRTYSSWGELTDEQWSDTTVSPAVTHHVVREYDGLGRLLHSEEQRDGVVDPETTNDYLYDEPVSVTGPVS